MGYCIRYYSNENFLNFKKHKSKKIRTETGDVLFPNNISVCEVFEPAGNHPHDVCLRAFRERFRFRKHLLAFPVVLGSLRPRLLQLPLNYEKIDTYLFRLFLRAGICTSF